MKRSEFSIDFGAMRKIDRNWSSNIYWHVLDQVYFLPWPSSPTQLRKALKIAPEGVRLFFLAGIIKGPVEDGGLGQYFATRRPLWLHELAKKTIAEFGCLKVIEILEEAQVYVERNRDKLYDGMPLAEWLQVMGVVAMNRNLNDINRRFMRACADLDDAQERYLKRHRDRFL